MMNHYETDYDLKSCPFCRSEAKVTVERERLVTDVYVRIPQNYYTVGCRGNDVLCPGRGIAHPAGALPYTMARWNERMPVPQSSADHERIELLSGCICPVVDRTLGLSTECAVHGTYARDLAGAEAQIEQAIAACWSEADDPVGRIIEERDEAIADRDRLMEERDRK